MVISTFNFKISILKVSISYILKYKILTFNIKYLGCSNLLLALTISIIGFENAKIQLGCIITQNIIRLVGHLQGLDQMKSDFLFTIST